MGRFIDLQKEYDKASYARVINLMKERKLPLLEPIYYFNTVVDVNGNIIKRLFYVNQRTLYNKGWTKQEEYVNRRSDDCIGEIYSIVNNRTGKRYIGQSENFLMRKENHINALLSGKHSSSCLQCDFFLLGSDQFTFEILESVKYGTTLKQREEELILEYGTEFPNGYNSPIKGNTALRSLYNDRYSKALRVSYTMRKDMGINKYSFLDICKKDFLEKRRELIKKTYREANGRRYFFQGFKYVISWFPPLDDDTFLYLGLDKQKIESADDETILDMLRDNHLPENFKKVYYHWVDFMNRLPRDGRGELDDPDDESFSFEDTKDEFEGLYDD